MPRSISVCGGSWYSLVCGCRLCDAQKAAVHDRLPECTLAPNLAHVGTDATRWKVCTFSDGALRDTRASAQDASASPKCSAVLGVRHVAIAVGGTTSSISIFCAPPLQQKKGSGAENTPKFQAASFFFAASVTEVDLVFSGHESSRLTEDLRSHCFRRTCSHVLVAPRTWKVQFMTTQVMDCWRTQLCKCEGVCVSDMSIGIGLVRCRVRSATSARRSLP